MKWLLEHFQIVFVIVVALASLVKRRQEVAQTEEQERQARKDMAEEAAAEELGPASNPQLPVAPPVARQESPPVARKAPPPLARLGEVPPPVRSDEVLILKQQQDIQERLQQIRDTKATTTGGAVATRSRVSAAQRHLKAAPIAKTGLRARLHSRQEVRRAMVLREILSPPVALR